MKPLLGRGLVHVERGYELPQQVQRLLACQPSPAVASDGPLAQRSAPHVRAASERWRAALQRANVLRCRWPDRDSASPDVTAPLRRDLIGSKLPRHATRNGRSAAQGGERAGGRQSWYSRVWHRPEAAMDTTAWEYAWGVPVRAQTPVHACMHACMGQAWDSGTDPCRDASTRGRDRTAASSAS